MVGPLLASEQDAQRLNLRLIDGRAVVLVELQRGEQRMPVQAVIDLGVRAPALLHERTAAALGFRGKSSVAVRFVDDGFTWPHVTATSVELEPMETFTSRHAAELDNIPAALVLGLPAFTGRLLELDLAAGHLTLWPRELSLDEALAELTGRGSDDGAITVLPFEAEAYGYWLNGTAPGGEDCRVRLNMSEGATRINGVWATELGWPAGDLPALKLGELDLMRHAVLAPTDFSSLPEPWPDVSLGTWLLERFRVLIDVDGGVLALIPVADGPMDSRVRRYYAARMAGDPDAVERFLDASPPEAYRAEAAEVLVLMRMDQRPGDLAAIERSLVLVSETAPLSARAGLLVRVADEAIALEKEHPLAFEIARLALKLAQDSAAADLNGTATHHINARLGLIALLEEDLTEARRLLLSAMFGLPADPYVNLWLGRLYEVSGQQRRAWSRYARSVLADDPPIGAFRGLERVFNDPSIRSGFTAREARHLLEGQLDLIRVVPPRAARLLPFFENESFPARTPVVSFYVNADHPASEQALLAWEALTRQLPNGTGLAFHTGDGLAGDASNRWIESQGVESGPALEVNGRVGRMPIEMDAETLLIWCYDRIDESLGSDGGEASDSLWALRAVYDSGVIRLQGLPKGSRLDSADDHDRLRVWLVESIVFCPGESKSVFHPSVVRGALSPREDGFWEVGLASLTVADGDPRSAQHQMDNARPNYRPTLIDPRACEVVVAKLDADGRIERAVRVPVDVPEGAWP